MTQQTMSIRDAAIITGLAQDTLRNYCNAGRLGAYKALGDKSRNGSRRPEWRIPHNAVDSLLYELGCNGGLGAPK